MEDGLQYDVVPVIDKYKCFVLDAEDEDDGFVEIPFEVLVLVQWHAAVHPSVWDVMQHQATTINHCIDYSTKH